MYKSPQDTTARVLRDIPYGDVRFTANGSRMLLLVQDPQHDKGVAYDVESPGSLNEAFRRTWDGYFVTDAAVSASGSLSAMMLQPPPEKPAARCLMVTLDRGGTEISPEDRTEVNPPITFVGELQLVGTLSERERPFQGRPRVRPEIVDLVLRMAR